MLIHGTIALLWLLLFARAFVLDGLFAWSIGIVYVGYDTALLAFVFWQTRGLARRLPAMQRGGGESGDPLGVVVAAHNEAGVLSLTLSALFTQSEPPDLVVIADDGSTDGTAALLEASFGLAPPMVGAISAAGGFGRLGHRCFGSGHTD